MIDTIKIYTEINNNIYNAIYNNSTIKTSYDKASGEVFYEVINGHLCGSYDSRLSVRVGCGAKYHFCNLGYYIEIEGSYHKIVKGYNSHNGFCNLEFISQCLIDMVSVSYNITLPKLDSWFLQRCDVAICYDLGSQKNVISYINSLSRCTYPRRNVKFYFDESLYLTGTTSTLKIYNKLLEFKKHDIKKFLNTNFELDKYLKEIDGFLRFECEIKKKKLSALFNNIDHIKVVCVNYDMLKNIWRDEFMKLLNFVDNELNIVRNREDVQRRLITLFPQGKAIRLYNFYCAIQLNGLLDTKICMSKRSFYRYVQELKEAKVDFSQSYKIVEQTVYFFNPFEAKEVA